MRRDETVLRPDERVVGGGRFARQYVEPGSRQLTGLQGGGEGGFVYQRAAPRVDQKSGRLHGGEGFRVHHSVGFFGQRAM